MAIARLDNFEERIRRRERIFKIPVQRLRDRQNPLEWLNAIQFKDRFHMYKGTAIFISQLINNDLASPIKRGCYIPPIIQLLTVLRYYATGSFQITIGDIHTFSQGTVSKLIKRVSIAIAKQSSKFIKYPSFGQAPIVREKFYDIAGFPGVVGIIDGCHIKMNSPGGENAELYRNRKSYFSINVQGICDPNLNFTNIVSRWYGSVHDSRMFENSSIYADLENDRSPGTLLGDSGYALTTFLLTPLTNPATPSQKRYQKAHLTTRNMIERTFGIWKKKFPCLLHFRIKLETILIVIVATAVLHNITRQRNDIFKNDEWVREIPVLQETNNNFTLSGAAFQKNVISSHFG